MYFVKMAESDNQQEELWDESKGARSRMAACVVDDPAAPVLQVKADDRRRTGRFPHMAAVARCIRGSSRSPLA